MYIAVCPRCGSERRAKANRCLDCLKAAVTAWRRANKERARAANAAWQNKNRAQARKMRDTWNAANRERHKAMIKAWGQKNQTRIKVRKAALRKADPEKFRKKEAARRAANPAAARTSKHNRRAKEKGATGTHTAAQWLDLLASYHGKCVYCGAKATTRDHVTPLGAGGTNSIDNIAPACLPCNSSKHTRPLLIWMTQQANILGFPRMLP